VYAPAGDAAYATPNGEIVHVPQDFAFADTVVALEEEIPTTPVSQRPPPSIPPPPSARPPMSRPPASYGDQHTRQHELADLHAQQQLHMQQQLQMQQMQQMQMPGPISQPPLSARSYPPPSFEPGIAGALQRAKHTINSSRGEMQELWSATDASEEKDPLVRLARRVKTFWGFFEWDKDDVARAAWIGLAVFVIVVCAAFVLR
jgi:hypothetical protein